MKVSLNWLREWLPVQSGSAEIAALLTDIGLETESVSVYESIKGGLKGLIVGEVVDVQKHPDADKLKLTQVNIGNGELLGIVCGAPNVEKGQKVIVAQAGTTIYPLKGDPFTIRKAKIRGVESNGMLCAEDEIGLGESHEGLLILPDSAAPGTNADTYISVYRDEIIEIGLTANHADANSVYGVARELEAAMHCRGIEQTELKKIIPDTSFTISQQGAGITVTVENTEACPRYSGLLIKNLKIAPSPAWLQNKLKAMGMRPINNAVDITNYILLELGQPLHAFDAEKIRGEKIIVGTLPEATPFITLDEKERELHETDLMICDEEGGLCIAGVYGGMDSGITENTTSLFLESAYFNPVWISRTERLQGLKTEASSRFSKGTDPEITVIALQRAAQMMKEICGAEPETTIIDIYPQKVQPFSVFLRSERIKLIGAVAIPQNTIEEILTSLHIKIVSKTEKGWQLEIPSYKNDVTREIDVIEEILRLYGYNNIPMPTSIRMPYLVNPKPDREKIRDDYMRYLSAQGCYEIFTNAISKSKYVKKWIPGIENTQVTLLNSLNADLDCMRQTMLFTGLEVIAFNRNRKNTDLKFFESGRIYFHEGDKYKEYDRLSLFLCGNNSDESWRMKTRPADFYDLKLWIELLAKKSKAAIDFLPSGTTTSEFSAAADIPSALLEDATLILLNNTNAGFAGKVKEEILEEFDIRVPVYFAEISWNALVHATSSAKTEFAEIQKFPSVRRDLALLLEPSLPFEKVKEIAEKEGSGLLKDLVLFDIYAGEKMQGKKSLAVGLIFQHHEHTLTDNEVDTVMKKLMDRLEKELGAEIRKN